MTETLLTGIEAIRSSSLFAPILAVAVLYGAFTEGFDRLWRDFLLKNIILPSLRLFQPTAWFGIIGILSVPVSLVLTKFARQRIDTQNNPALHERC